MVARSLPRTARSASDAATAEVLGQLGPGPMEPGLDRPDRPADHLGDLLVGEPLFVEEDEDRAVVGTELIEGPAQLPGEVVGVVQARAVVDAFLGRLGEDRPSGASPE